MAVIVFSGGHTLGVQGSACQLADDLTGDAGSIRRVDIARDRQRARPRERRADRYIVATRTTARRFAQASR